MFMLPAVAESLTGLDVILAYARPHVKDGSKVKMDPGSISLSRKVQDDERIPDPRPGWTSGMTLSSSAELFHRDRFAR